MIHRNIRSAKSQRRCVSAKSERAASKPLSVSAVRLQELHRRLSKVSSHDEEGGDADNSVVSELDIMSDIAFDDSNRNVVDLDVDITDVLIEKTTKLLSFNQRAVSGVSTRDGKAIRLGTTGALAVWKSEHDKLRSMIELLL